MKRCVLIDCKHLLIGLAPIPPTGRLKKFRHRPGPKSIYIQLFWLEVVVWYG